METRTRFDRSRVNLSNNLLSRLNHTQTEGQMSRLVLIFEAEVRLKRPYQRPSMGGAMPFLPKMGAIYARPIIWRLSN
jgi:hypothetical protein